MDVQSAANLTIPEGGVRNIHDKDKRLLWSAVGYNVRYDGDTTQQTYSGKNLYLLKADGHVSQGITWQISNNTAHGTGTALSTYSELSTTSIVSTPLLAGTYTLSIAEPISNNITIYFREADNTQHSFTLTAGNTKVTFTTTYETTRSRVAIGGLTVNETVDLTISDLQLEAGSIATAFEPYVGGIPSPSPDYPQDVNVVTGAQTVTVTGKNLLKLGNNNVSPSSAASQGATITINDNSIRFVATGTDITQYAYCFTGELDPNKQYVLSGAVTKVAQASTARVTYSYSDNGTTWANNTTAFSQSPMPAGTTATFSQTLSGHKYYRFGVYNSFGATVIGTETYYYDIQIEESSTATDYEPYQSRSYTVDLGSTELCKLGAYQDYIYKSGDGWYKYAEIGKRVFNGSENWTVTNTGTVNFYYALSNLNLGFTKNTLDLVSNYGSPGEVGNTNTKQGIIIVPAGGNNQLRIRYGTEMTVANWQSKLSTTNMVLYYTLVTPTNTKITDSTLVSQLNAIHDWLTRYDYYGNVTGNLPIIINRTGLT